MPAAVGTGVGRPRRPQGTPGRPAPVVLVLPGAFTGPRLCRGGLPGPVHAAHDAGEGVVRQPLPQPGSPMAGDTHAHGQAPSGRLAAPPEGLTRGEQSGRSGKLSKQSGSTGQVGSVAMALVTKETSGGQGQNEGQTDTRRALTHGAGYKVDPGRLHLDVEPVAVGHEQPCGEKARGPGGVPCDGRPCFQTGPGGQPATQGANPACSTRAPPTGRSQGRPPRTPVPGTRMSPKPRREKGRSHRASGEAFSRGTFRTMGSWGEQEVPCPGGRACPALFSGQRPGRGPPTYLLVGGRVRGPGCHLHHDAVPTLTKGGVSEKGHGDRGCSGRAGQGRPPWSERA